MATRRVPRVLSGRYELKDRLGTGGMAEVWLGRDRVLGRTVAIKTLHGQFAGDPSFIARFRREAQSAAALNHPNIVGVYDTGNDDGTYYIVMEYVDGRTLRDLVREEGPLLPERAAEICADVSAALAYAHANGIIHRDVKPANIMITEAGRVKVADFGIARAISGDSVTQTATVLGTAQYFSPEQAQGAAVDQRSDIYSLGIVLYEMLTRQVPFTGSSPVAIAYKHVKEEPIIPSRLNADIPQSLEAVVMKALAKNPENRYQSATELREDLIRAVQGQPVSAPPVLDDRTTAVNPLADETVVISRRGTGLGPRRDTGVRDPERRRRRTGYLLLTLIALGIVALLVWALSGAVSKPKLVAIPDVVGMTDNEAQRILEERGLRFDIDLGPSDEYPSGVVASQDPEAGERIEKGEVVKLIVSTGAPLVEVPKVEGLSRADATRRLEEVGLKVGRVDSQFDDKVAAGRVIDQNPGAGRKVQKGEQVDLTVSKGKETAIVPDVVGFLESDARVAIENRGLKVTVVRQPTGFNCQQPPGRACSQDPPGGTEVQRGSTVTIVVAEEPGPPPEESPSPEPSPSPSPTESPASF